MGVNLESRRIRRLYQQQPVSRWTRSPGSAGSEHPVRIHTLGRFGVQVHQQPLSLSQAPRQRPFELLKALIACGGRDVHAEILSQALWPDAEGDSAQNAFDVTLHRLRRIFGVKELFIVCDHRLTLNSRLAWVDAWAFERLANHSEKILKRAKDLGMAQQLARCSDRLLHLYQGGFLEREAMHTWALTLRERLRSKLLRHILDAGQVWEDAGEWDRAIRFYRRGLEIEPLTEQYYQRLMICYRATRRLAEAMAIFQRCRQVLAEQFQLSPSTETLRLYASLRNRAPQQT